MHRPVRTESQKESLCAGSMTTISRPICARVARRVAERKPLRWLYDKDGFYQTTPSLTRVAERKPLRWLYDGLRLEVPRRFLTRSQKESLCAGSMTGSSGAGELGGTAASQKESLCAGSMTAGTGAKTSFLYLQSQKESLCAGSMTAPLCCIATERLSQP